MKRLVSSAVAGSAVLAAALLATVSANATVLVAGGAGPPDPLTLGAGSSLLADIVNGTITSDLGGSDFSGTYSEAVYRDPTRGNELTFLIQVHNNASSGNGMGRATASSFAGFFTDAGVLTSGTPAPFTSNPINPPRSVDRTANGSGVGFTYENALGEPDLAPGTTTQILEIETNALAFTAGKLSVINDGVATVPGFAPTVVPIPGALGLFAAGLGFLGLTAARKRNTKRQSLLAAM